MLVICQEVHVLTNNNSIDMKPWASIAAKQVLSKKIQDGEDVDVHEELARLGFHSSDSGANLKLDPPVAVAYSEQHTSFTDARRRGAQITRWTHAKRQALIRGELGRLKQLARSSATKKRSGLSP